jgi:hypothetical protein
LSNRQHKTRKVPLSRLKERQEQLSYSDLQSVNQVLMFKLRESKLPETSQMPFQDQETVLT